MDLRRTFLRTAHDLCGPEFARSRDAGAIDRAARLRRPGRLRHADPLRYAGPPACRSAGEFERSPARALGTPSPGCRDRGCRRATPPAGPRALQGVPRPEGGAGNASARRRRGCVIPPRGAPPLRKTRETMDKAFSPADIESRIYATWEAAGYFSPS